MSNEIDRINAEIIISECLSAFGLELNDVMRGSRKRNVIDCVKIMCYFIKIYTRLSLSEIGELINRDHATVIYHFQEVCGRMKVDVKFSEDIVQIEKRISQKIKNFSSLSKSDYKMLDYILNLLSYYGRSLLQRGVLIEDDIRELNKRFIKNVFEGNDKE